MKTKGQLQEIEDAASRGTFGGVTPNGADFVIEALNSFLNGYGPKLELEIIKSFAWANKLKMFCILFHTIKFSWGISITLPRITPSNAKTPKPSQPSKTASQTSVRSSRPYISGYHHGLAVPVFSLAFAFALFFAFCTFCPTAYKSSLPTSNTKSTTNEVISNAVTSIDIMENHFAILAK